MRRLILMRHAKSSWSDPAQRDLDRPLNKRGKKSAGLIGVWLKRKGYTPDRALVSSARRAQETWAGVVAKAGAAPTTYLPELYHAGPEAMLETLQRAGEGDCTLIVGHQPGIGAFGQRLLAMPAADAGFEKFKTGATAVIDFDVDRWLEVAWGTGRLVDFVVPRALEGSPA
jgi:phosphohistidine phosphatase